MHAHVSSEYSSFQITEISFNSYFQICACQKVVFVNFPLFIPVRQMKLPLQLSCIPLHHESYLFPCLTLDKDRNFVLVQVIIGVKKHYVFIKWHSNNEQYSQISNCCMYKIAFPSIYRGCINSNKCLPNLLKEEGIDIFALTVLWK